MLGEILAEWVYQSNFLIQARKNFDLLCMRIFLVGLIEINPHLSKRDKYFDEKFQEMFLPMKKLSDMIGGNKRLEVMHEACKKMSEASVEIRDKGGRCKLIKLFKHLTYEPYKGLSLCFDDGMRPYILDLFKSGGYTRINPHYLFRLTSPYAVRLLELLLQYKNIKYFRQLNEITRKITVEDLRFMLNVPEGAYLDRMDNFRKHVLDVPIEEINKHTPYIVRYKPIKEGRRVVAFNFVADTEKAPVEFLHGYTPKYSDSAINLLHSLGFTEQAARAIYLKCKDAKDCFERTMRAELLLERFIRTNHKIRNKLGFLRAAITENWRFWDSPRSEEDLAELKDLQTKKERRKEARKKKSQASKERSKKSQAMTPLAESVQQLQTETPLSETETTTLTTSKLSEVSDRQLLAELSSSSAESTATESVQQLQTETPLSETKPQETINSRQLNLSIGDFQLIIKGLYNMLEERTYPELEEEEQPSVQSPPESTPPESTPPTTESSEDMLRPLSQEEIMAIPPMKQVGNVLGKTFVNDLLKQKKMMTSQNQETSSLLPMLPKRTRRPPNMFINDMEMPYELAENIMRKIPRMVEIPYFREFVRNELTPYNVSTEEFVMLFNAYYAPFL